MKRDFAFLVCLLLSGVSGAQVITVDDDGSADYTTIQAAIDASGTGDIIVVCPGTYTGTGNYNIDFGGRAITVRSIGPQDPAVVAATIIDCQYQGSGFYFYNSEGANSVIDGLTITDAGDYDYDGGGIYCGGSSPTIANCRILSSIGYLGGGICNDYGSSPTLVNCVFSNNEGSSGGAISNIVSDPNVINCTFISNVAWEGGGIYNDVSWPTISNSVFSGNEADYGGAMSNIYYSNPTITNCTFTDNSAIEQGGVLYNNGHSHTTFVNCILRGDVPDEIYVSTGTVTVDYSNVQGGYSGTGNINEDPLFVDADGLDNEVGTEDDNLRLLGGSPCIDAGNSTVVGADAGDLDDDGGTSEQLPWDPDGNLRFMDDPNIPDTGATYRSVPIVDMGAYENSGLTMVGDFEPDGDVDMDDLAVIVVRWLDLGCGRCSGADLSGDGNINLADFAKFARTGLVGGGESHKPILATIGNKSVIELQNLNFTISATDPDGDDLTYSVFNLPDGAEFDPQTRVFDWTPSAGQTGQFFVTFLASDDIEVDSETIAITVIQDLVGYWTMDDDANSPTVIDSSANGNHGTARQNTEDLSTTGIIDGALTFNGTSDYINLASPADLDDLPADDFTVSAWIYDESTTGKGLIIGSFYDGSAGWILRKQGIGADLYIDFWAAHSTTAAYYVTPAGSLAAGNWYHIAAIWDAGTKTCKIYIDGAESSYVTVTPGQGSYNTDAAYDKEIGRMALSGGTQYFDGKIDDVKIFERILSDTEILQLATGF